MSDSKPHDYKHYYINLAYYLDITTNYHIKGKHEAY